MKMDFSDWDGENNNWGETPLGKKRGGKVHSSDQQLIDRVALVGHKSLNGDTSMVIYEYRLQMQNRALCGPLLKSRVCNGALYTFVT